jgi:hypothetical protein
MVEPYVIPDYLLERLAAGDLTQEEQRQLGERLALDGGGAARMASLAADGVATLSRHPPALVAAEVARRAGRHDRPRRLWVLAPVAAVVALAIVAWPARGPVAPPREEDATIVKGLQPHLVIHRMTADGAARLSPGDSARAGERLQLGYVAAGSRFGAVVSLDGRGTVTRHWPAAGPTAAPLTPRGEVLLSESFRLDDAPAFERFILIVGDRPFALQGVLDAAAALAHAGDARDAPLRLDAGLTASSFFVTKESR